MIQDTGQSSSQVEYRYKEMKSKRKKNKCNFNPNYGQKHQYRFDTVSLMRKKKHAEA